MKELRKWSMSNALAIVAKVGAEEISVPVEICYSSSLKIQVKV